MVGSVAVFWQPMDLGAAKIFLGEVPHKSFLIVILASFIDFQVFVRKLNLNDINVNFCATNLESLTG